MTTPEEIRASWSDANIARVRMEEYRRDLAAMPPKQARKLDLSIRRSEWRERHRRVPGVLARLFVH